ncbi:hypothetical protein BRADI_4g05435v3, partial [Brachypodium distachyon]
FATTRRRRPSEDVDYYEDEHERERARRRDSQRRRRQEEEELARRLLREFEEEEEKIIDTASATAMEALHVPAVGEAREQDCAVCLDELFDDGGGGGMKKKLRMMPCSHSFHERCIFRWLRLNRRCPTCRFEIAASGTGQRRRRFYRDLQLMQTLVANSPD